MLLSSLQSAVFSYFSEAVAMVIALTGFGLRQKGQKDNHKKSF